MVEQAPSIRRGMWREPYVNTGLYSVKLLILGHATLL
jgi:hypothetical protein